MRQNFDIPAEGILPTGVEILLQQGVPEAVASDPALLSVAAAGLTELEQKIHARAIHTPISLADFGVLFQGAGRNDQPSPLEGIYPGANGLFLFAVTCGAGVSSRIAELFADNDYATAMALDSAASLAADKAAALVQEKVSAEFTEKFGKDGNAAMRYSPGYCGWHVSGQGAMFDALSPQEIGLKLTDSFLMDPLKSISGVIVIGPAEIHRFKPDFSFCASCADKQCRGRIAALNSGTERKS